MVAMADSGRHVSNTMARLVLEYIEQELGEGSMIELLRRAGDDRAVEVVLDDSNWSSYSQFRRLLEEAAIMLGGVERLRDIGRKVSLVGGSMPSATEMLQLLGSPSALFAELGAGHNGIVTFVDVNTKQLGPTEWLIEERTIDGFESFPEFCSFNAGIHPMTTRLFGYEPADVVEETCVLRGSDYCRFRISWQEVDEATRERSRLEQRVTLLERRLETFQDTVAEIVGASDLDTALRQIISAAARAVRAPGFVLAVTPRAGLDRFVYSDGLPEDEANRLAASMLAGEPCDGLRDDLVVNIESHLSHYGRLAAYDPAGILMNEGPMLAAYARLAAAALDSATAVATAREEAGRARALLDLSAAIADFTTTDGIAMSLARAIPAVIGADRAAVALVDHDAGVVRVAADHGGDGSLLGLEFPISDAMPTQITYAEPSDPLSNRRQLMEVTGTVALVEVPVVIDGQPAALLTAGVSTDPGRLAPGFELEERLIGLAAQASTALRNARLIEQIQHQALHDALTGLPNRTLILDRAEQMLARSRRDRTPVAALFIDLDGFKEINDTLGHAVGDQLLRSVAARLAATIRGSDTLARLGGDEFVVLVESISSDVGPEMVAQRLLDVLREPFVLDARPDVRLTVSASIGIARAADRTTAGDLLRDADVALYQAKAAGKNQAMVFAPEMQAAVRARMELEMDLRTAVEFDQFFVVYQPIFDLRTYETTGVEALVRWQHPLRGVVEPNDFIPLLEETGLINDVGRFVLHEACRQTAAWHAQGHMIDVSVNVSARQLDSDQLVGDVADALRLSGLAPTRLILEVTETTIMRDTEATVRRLSSLKEQGVRLAIDDFGTGYSSLAYLQQFPVDALKIDRSFIDAISESDEAGALIHTLVHLGKALGLSTLAEGIEVAEQFDRLCIEDCDSGQGFLFARPLPPDELESFLTGSSVTAVTDTTQTLSPN